MVGIILTLFGIIALVISICLFTNDQEGYGETAVIGIILSFMGICFIAHEKTCGSKPHDGCVPTIEDVSRGEAHIDTLKATCKYKTEYQLFINWNDSIIPRSN